MYHVWPSQASICLVEISGPQVMGVSHQGFHTRSLEQHLALCKSLLQTLKLLKKLTFKIVQMFHDPFWIRKKKTDECFFSRIIRALENCLGLHVY